MADDDQDNRFWPKTAMEIRLCSLRIATSCADPHVAVTAANLIRDAKTIERYLVDDEMPSDPVVKMVKGA